MKHLTGARFTAVLAGLVVLLGIMQYRLWFAQGSLAEKHRLEQQVEEQARINAKLRERNAVLEREVLALQSGNEAVEQRAREELGLVREGETFYHFVDEAPGNAEAQTAQEQSPLNAFPRSGAEEAAE